MSDDVEIGPDGVMLWKKVSPPLWWPATGHFVLADRHLPDGTRQHMVEGHVAKGVVLSGAQIFGKDDLKDVQYASKLSHLSGQPSGPSAQQQTSP